MWIYGSRKKLDSYKILLSPYMMTLEEGNLAEKG